MKAETVLRTVRASGSRALKMATTSEASVNLNGYVYRYEGKRNWRASADERWEIGCQRVENVERIGERRVDGSHMTVYRAADGTIYAARPGVEEREESNGPRVYTLHQLEKGGHVWDSAPQTAATLHEIKRAVRAGFLSGEPRWAMVDGRCVYALDAYGKETTRDVDAPG